MSAHPPIYHNITSLFVSVAVLMVSAGLFGSFTGLRAIHEGFSLDVAGLMMSAFYLGIILGTFYCGRLINKVGHIRSFGAFSALAAAAVLACGLWINPYVWLILRAIIGFNMAGLYMTIESWINGVVDNSSRGTVLAIYMVTLYLSMGSGQYLLEFAPIGEPDLFMLSALLFCVALVPFAISSVSYPGPMAERQVSLKMIYERSPVAILVCIGAGLLSGAIYGIAPIYASELGLTVAEVGVFMTTLIVSGLLLQFPLGRLSDHVDRRMVMLGVSLVGIIASIAIIYFSNQYSFFSINETGKEVQLLWEQTPTPMLLAAALFGSLTATLYPLAVAHAHDSTEPDERIAASGTLVLASGTGAMFGPPLASTTMAYTGVNGLFIFTTVVFILISVIVILRSRKVSMVPSAKEDFVLIPEITTSPINTELDPRLPDEEEYTSDTESGSASDATSDK